MTGTAPGLHRDLLTMLIFGIGRRLKPRRIRGHLVVTLPSGRTIELGQASHGPSAELHLKSWQPVWAAIRRADVGFCESYIDGEWDSPDPSRLFGFYVQNRYNRDAGAFRFRNLADKVWHMLRDNNPAGAKRNIEAHYDLGNDFYRQWLDGSMTYSAAWFGNGATELEAAQIAKYHLVLDTLDLVPGNQLLEIGCGWGGLAKEALARGAQVTGITLSQEQHRYASERLGDGADIRLQDYRDTSGTFDRIASIEMIEAVGEAHWPVYFQMLHDRLRPGGIAAIQAITINDQVFPIYRKGVDFIQRHIFPGGMLPTAGILQSQAQAAGLSFETIACFGRDYARTLSMWRENFEKSWPAIAGLGFDSRFRRKWRLYLDYCEAGFRDGVIDVGVYRFAKSR